MFPTVCRVCLTGDSRMLSMDVELMDLYEKISNAKVSSGGRSNRLCYICYSQLQKCLRFANLARRSEKYLNVLETGIEVNENTTSNMLNLVKLQTLSVINFKPICLEGLNKRREYKQKITKEQCEETNIKEEFDEKLTNERLIKNVTPIVVTKNVTPVVVSKNVTPIVVTKNKTPTIVSTKNETPLLVSKNVTPIVVTKNETPIVVTKYETPSIVVTKNVTPIVVTKNKTPIVVTKHETPVVVTKNVTPIVVPKNETPIVVTKYETKNVTPIVVTKNETPIVVTKNKTPIVVTKNETPIVVTKYETPSIVVTKTVTPTLVVTKNEYKTTKDSAKNIITIKGVIKYGATTKKDFNPNETTTEFVQNRITEDLTRKSLTKLVLTKNETMKNPIKELAKIETPTKVIKTDTTRLFKKEISIDELMQNPETEIDNELIYFESEDANEDIKDVKDYVVINDTELYYECDTCHDIFKTREELGAHQNTHKIDTKPKYKLEDIIERIPNTKEPYCPICKKFFAGYDSQLQEHLRIHTGERPYVCDLCGKTSRTKHHLKEHIRTHTKEKVYCKTCNKGFSQMSSLGKHMLIHTGVSPYFCHVCGKSFKQNGQMKAHIRFIHEGVRPYGCDVCGKRFPSKSEWRRHMDAHTGTKAFSCDRCGTKFATNTGMTRHKKRHCKMSGS